MPPRQRIASRRSTRTAHPTARSVRGGSTWHSRSAGRASGTARLPTRLARQCSSTVGTSTTRVAESGARAARSCARESRSQSVLRARQGGDRALGVRHARGRSECHIVPKVGHSTPAPATDASHCPAPCTAGHAKNAKSVSLFCSTPRQAASVNAGAGKLGAPNRLATVARGVPVTLAPMERHTDLASRSSQPSSHTPRHPAPGR